MTFDFKDMKVGDRIPFPIDGPWGAAHRKLHSDVELFCNSQPDEGRWQFESETVWSKVEHQPDMVWLHRIR